jgi:hypothetical protein
VLVDLDEATMERALKIVEAEPFDAFTVHPAGVAIYHLGNNGTARENLKAWPATGSRAAIRETVSCDSCVS